MKKDPFSILLTALLGRHKKYVNLSTVTGFDGEAYKETMTRRFHRLCKVLQIDKGMFKDKKGNYRFPKEVGAFISTLLKKMDYGYLADVVHRGYVPGATLEIQKANAHAFRAEMKPHIEAVQNGRQKIFCRLMVKGLAHPKLFDSAVKVKMKMQSLVTILEDATSDQSNAVWERFNELLDELIDDICTAKNRP